jgi:hypothetical protein
MRRGAQNKYVVNQKLEHVEDISFREQKMVTLISNTSWSHLDTYRKQFHNASFHYFRQAYVSIKADLKAIGPIAPNWGPP